MYWNNLDVNSKRYKSDDALCLSLKVHSTYQYRTHFRSHLCEILDGHNNASRAWLSVGAKYSDSFSN